MKTLDDLMIDNEDLKGLFTWDDAQEQIEMFNSLSYKGFSNWRLPTRDEFDKINLKRDEISGFNSFRYLKRNKICGYSTDGYWSSSEYDADSAWIHYFGHGYQNYGSKYYTKLVRCVRSI